MTYPQYYLEYQDHKGDWIRLPENEEFTYAAAARRRVDHYMEYYVNIRIVKLDLTQEELYKSKK